MATFLHMTSTGENPQHEHCPAGANSWCKFRAAQATGSMFKHPPSLHPDVAKLILPIYTELSRPDLVKRCLGGHTQNAQCSLAFGSETSALWDQHNENCHYFSRWNFQRRLLLWFFSNKGIILKTRKKSSKLLLQVTTLFCEWCTNSTLSSGRAVEVSVIESRMRESTARSAAAVRWVVRRPQHLKRVKPYDEEEELFYGPGIADYSFSQFEWVENTFHKVETLNVSPKK